MSGPHRAFRGFLAVLALSTTGCPSGYEFRAVPGQVHVNAKDVIASLAKDARAGCKAGLQPYVHCETEPALCRADPLTGTTISAAACGELVPLMTFVHMSDAQLKEDQISMAGLLGVEAYDHINGGSRRDPVQERFDFAVLLATVLGVNSVAASGGSHRPESYAPCKPPLPPSFLVHTGDAIDAGMFSELYEFLTVMNELDVPFFNAVGNHDNLFFGTFPKQAMTGFDVTLPFVPLGDTDRFLLAHSPDASQIDPSIPYRPAGNRKLMVARRAPPPPGVAPSPVFSSVYAGFDLSCPLPNAGDTAQARALAGSKYLPAPSFPRREGGLCADAHGYYGEDFLLPPSRSGRPRKVRLLVLNTAEIPPRTVSQSLLEQRSRGNMRPEQYLWLERELGAHTETETVFLVAGHHNLAGFVEGQKGSLEKLLEQEPRVAAYFTGHTHVNAFHRHARAGAEPLLEVIAGSTLVYPQLANLVDLLENDAGELYVRVRSFRQRVGDAFCGSDCSLKYLAASGRNGAYNDRTDGDRREEADAKKNANGLFRVSGFAKGLR